MVRGGGDGAESVMVLTTNSPVNGTDETLTRRALRHALDGTTDLAETVLRVPLHYYRDPKITEIEESQILRRVPLPIVPSARTRNVVRSTPMKLRPYILFCFQTP